MEIKRDVLLKPLTTFKIGGRAKYFVEVEKREDLKKAVLFAKEKKIPFFVLAGGSNVLVSDKGYRGLVIKMKNSKIEIREGKKILAEAGTPLVLLVREAIKNSLAGVEWAAGIPGTVGGAIFGNAGAFGFSTSDFLKLVEVFNLKDFSFKILEKKDCRFGYRDSVFKKNKNLIIFSGIFELKKGKQKEILKKKEEFLKIKKETQELSFPSAGCVFKNYQGKIEDKNLLKEFPKLREFNKKGQIPAGFLIEACGLKGKREGGIEISKKHANFFINLGNGKAKEVKKLIELSKQKVKEKFGILLKEEILFLGDF